MTPEDMKNAAALRALEFIEEGKIIGIGTGSTVTYLIDHLAKIKDRIEGTVSSSKATTARLKQHGIPVFDLNTINDLPLYIDSVDEIDSAFRMIKGGAGAMTCEKIVATVAKKMICIADQTKKVDVLGSTRPIPIEVIPMARSYVGRELAKLGGDPVYREGFITDQGNIIIDAYSLDLSHAIILEETLNNITGVVAHGLFAKRRADMLILGTEQGVEILKTPNLGVST